MVPLIVWMLGLSFAAAVMVMTVAFQAQWAQFALSLVIAGFIALAAVRDHRALCAMSAFPAHAASTLIRHMGLIYAWAAVSIVLIYGLLVRWPQWFVAFFMMCLGATLCLFMANVLMRDLNEESDDRRMLTLVTTIAKAQFATTCVMFGGLLAFGKLSSLAMAGHVSWAAINVMLCAAVALAALSGYTIVNPSLTAAPTEGDAVQPGASEHLDPVTQPAEPARAPIMRAATPAVAARRPSVFSAKARSAAQHRQPPKPFGRARPA